MKIKTIEVEDIGCSFYGHDYGEDRTEIVNAIDCLLAFGIESAQIVGDTLKVTFKKEQRQSDNGATVKFIYSVRSGKKGR